MASIYDVNANELIEKVAEELKKISEIKPPAWASYVKTGVHKQRPPVEADWWFMRTAAILRSIYRLGPVGVSKLRTKYGGKKDRGHKPEHFFKGSGSIIRKACQQLEAAGLIKQTQIGVHKGRVVTPKGQSLLDKVATEILGKPVTSEKRSSSDGAQKPKVSDKSLKPAVEDKPKAKPKAEKTSGKQSAPDGAQKAKLSDKVEEEAPAEPVVEEPKAEEVKKEVAKVEELTKELQKKGTLRDAKKELDKVPSAHELAAAKKQAKNE